MGIGFDSMSRRSFGRVVVGTAAAGFSGFVPWSMARAATFEPALIYDYGGKFDRSFNQAAYQGATRWFTCHFLWMCPGYYNYEQAYTPAFPGLEQYQGVLVHPQFWPEDLDYRGKTVIVIGSGATAVTRGLG